MSTKPNKRLTYLATPYSKYIYGRQQAYQDACSAAAALMLKGYNVFCPIAHSHAIETNAMNKNQDGDFWLKQDFAILVHCDELIVYCMSGWKESYGVNKEIEFAEANNIPVRFVHDISTIAPEAP